MKLFVWWMCLFVSAATAVAADKIVAPAKAQVLRGKYLVEDAGQCQDCHSPRNEKGEYIKERWLQGTPLMFRPTIPVPVFAEAAPDVTGLMGWSKADGVSFFMTGATTQGLKARPPMPAYRFSRADAEAITAYLMSLKPEKSAKH